MTGATSPRSGGAAVGRRRTPSNHSRKPPAVHASEIQANPARLAAVGSGGSPSSRSASGSSTVPPRTSCHAVAANRFAGGPARLVSTTPTLNDTVAPIEARIPTGSSCAPGRTTTSPTPAAATAPMVSSRAVGRRPVISQVSSPTRSGCSPPAAAATPPGSRETPTTSSGKKSPKLNTARIAVFNHPPPCGRHGETSRPRASSTTPAGSTRAAATVSGRPCGSSWVTVTAVVPHINGASAVRAVVRSVP